MNRDLPLRTTLFADVAGSTGLYQRHGDRRALAAIESCLALIESVSTSFGGRVVKSIGDELMVLFDSAGDAFQAACEMQWQVSDLPPLGSDALAIRIGFHCGPTIEQGSDVFGDSVNVAARLAHLARAGQIITSGRTVAMLDPVVARHLRKINRVTLKGMQVEETIFEGLWKDSDNITAMLSDSSLAPTGMVRVVLQHGAQRIEAGPGHPPISVGRDAGNAIVVRHRNVSRVHAMVEWRGDKFVVADRSTNGTFVCFDNGAETVLRLEEMTLLGQGLLTFGQPASAGAEGAVTFACEALASAGR
jgi:hypothetical protein